MQVVVRIMEKMKDWKIIKINKNVIYMIFGLFLVVVMASIAPSSTKEIYTVGSRTILHYKVPLLKTSNASALKTSSVAKNNIFFISQNHVLLSTEYFPRRQENPLIFELMESIVVLFTVLFIIFSSYYYHNNIIKIYNGLDPPLA